MFCLCFICTVHRRRQTVFGILHQLDGLLIVFYFHDTNKRSKRFIFHHAHVVIHINKDRWLKKIPYAFNFFSAGQNFCPFGNSIGYLVFQNAQLFFPAQRTDVNSVFCRRPGLPWFHFFYNLIYILIIDFFMYIYSFHGTTALTIVIKRSIGCSGSHWFYVCYVIGNIQWILAA